MSRQQAQLVAALDDLKADTRCQARECMDEQTLEEYADAYRAGEALPPLDVFKIEGELVIVDGFHRHEAARRAGVLTLAVRVVGEGSMTDAEWHALASNQKHGLRRTREDKRRAVRLALELDPNRSNREIARHVGVSDPFVGKIRAEQEPGLRIPPHWLDPNLIRPETVEMVARMNRHISHESMKIRPRDVERNDRIKHLSPYLHDEIGKGELTMADAEEILWIAYRDTDQSKPYSEVRSRLMVALRSECEPEIEAEKQAADAAGYDVETYRKARRVIDAANEEPEKYGELSRLIDVGAVEAAFKKMIRRDRGIRPELTGPRDVADWVADMEKVAAFHDADAESWKAAADWREGYDYLLASTAEHNDVRERSKKLLTELRTGQFQEPDDPAECSRLWERGVSASKSVIVSSSDSSLRQQRFMGQLLEEAAQ